MRHDGSSPSTDGAAAKPKPRPKPKPVPKAKTAQQEATKADLFFFSCHGHTQPNKFMHTTSPANDQTLSGYEGCLRCNSGMQELEKQAGSSGRAGTPVFFLH